MFDVKVGTLLTNPLGLLGVQGTWLDFSLRRQFSQQ
jgi:hypothetical protein